LRFIRDRLTLSKIEIFEALVGREAPERIDMRLMIPLIVVMTLASSTAMAGEALSYNQQAYAVSQLALNPPSMAPTPDVFGDSPDRIRVAEQAARLINAGDCKGARKLVARRADQRMAARVEEVCAAPKAE
jgi:hypothetical protein